MSPVDPGSCSGLFPRAMLKKGWLARGDLDGFFVLTGWWSRRRPGASPGADSLEM